MSDHQYQVTPSDANCLPAALSVDTVWIQKQVRVGEDAKRLREADAMLCQVAIRFGGIPLEAGLHSQMLLHLCGNKAGNERWHR